MNKYLILPFLIVHFAVIVTEDPTTLAPETTTINSATNETTTLPTDGGSTSTAVPSETTTTTVGMANNEATTTMASTTNETTTISYSDLPVKDGKVVLTKEEWKKRLTSEQYRVTREMGTEQSFTGEFYANKKNGTYTCICCGQELFSSEHKFDSGTGWPSFYQPIRNESIVNVPDNSHGMERTETKCGRCDAHLGHVFEDGPKPTGLRYCINSVSLNFHELKQ